MAIDSIGKRKSAASSRGGFRGGYVSSGAGDALEATSQQILTLLNAMPTTIDDALENYRSNGVASTSDLAVAAADAEQAVALADATYTYVQTLPTAVENADAVDIKLTAEHGAGDWETGASVGDMTKVMDRLGWTLAINAGAVASPQNANSSYVITIDGVQYTAALAGQTAQGVRTSPTLTKV